MNNFSYIKVSDTKQAIAELNGDIRNKAVAGGTNINDLLKYFITKADKLVDINPIQEFNSIIRLDDGGVRLGALHTNAETAYDPIIEERYPLLSKAILAGASAQIRNMATNGGNLMQRTRCYYFYDINTPCNKRDPGSGCSAISGHNRINAILGQSENCIAVFPSDMCVALAALNAQVNISGPNGERKLPFAHFHRLPGETPHLDNNLIHGEIITSIDLPAEGFAENYSYLKIRDRSSYSFALVSVASAFELEQGTVKDARIALGGVAHKPWRVLEAEDFLKQKKPTRENFSQAAKIILNGAFGYEHNNFKIELAHRAIIRNCIMALNPESQRPGAKASL
ncbi:xanthine dehydrogenase family protein subunit M [Flavobacterium sp. YJ01]|uniref:FAD binding domain-containing protein n=1 Tax=unclassified Flavobacterium TaxID=196869 RepID=UPI0023E35961|nr:xanthine dehydrogenase family protein subunit M [Flavobacterium sp. YJ01]WET02393.1 xanthine dehydrogenase family protein subunit M [Flavobacterium sp. YJ01]